MKRRPVRRVVVHAAQVAVLTLSTAPVTSADAAPPRGEARSPAQVRAQVPAQAEQVSVRVSDRKVRATVRTQPGRSVALAYADPADPQKWKVLRETVVQSGADGVAQIVFDIASYRDQPVTVAVVTAADASFEQGLRATEPAEIVLKEGQVFTGAGEAKAGSPAALKGVTEVSAKGLSDVSAGPGALKGVSVSVKAAADPALRGRPGVVR